MCKTLFCHCMHQDVHWDWSLGGSLKHNWWMVMISWDTEILLRIIWYSCTNTCIENSFINNTTCFWFELLLLYFRAHSNIYIYLYFSLVSEWLAGTVYYNPILQELCSRLIIICTLSVAYQSFDQNNFLQLKCWMVKIIITIRPALNFLKYDMLFLSINC